jgi:hypothetical protein
MAGNAERAHALSGAQYHIWLAEHIGTAGATYYVGEYVEIRGPVEAALFERSLRQAVQETEALHARFVEGNDGPRQVLSPAPWSLPVIDLSTEPDPQAAAENRMRAGLAGQADPAQSSLFGYALYRLSATCFYWYQRYNYLVMDDYGWSLVAQRVAELYTSLAAGLAPAESAFGSLAGLLDEERVYR